jgi:hypothetical protein
MCRGGGFYTCMCLFRVGAGVWRVGTALAIGPNWVGTPEDKGRIQSLERVYYNNYAFYIRLKKLMTTSVV